MNNGYKGKERRDVELLGQALSRASCDGVQEHFTFNPPKKNKNKSKMNILSRYINIILGPTQPPVQWVPGLSRGWRRPGCGADPPPHLVPKV